MERVSKINLISMIIKSIYACFSLIILGGIITYGQQKLEKPELKDYSFGKAWTINSDSESLGKPYDTLGVVNTKRGEYFLLIRQLDQSEFRRRIETRDEGIDFIRMVGVDVPDKNGVALFSRPEGDTITTQLWIEYLNTTHIHISDMVFNKPLRITYLEINGRLGIYGSTFDEDVDFIGAKFFPEIDTVFQFFDSYFDIGTSLFKKNLIFNLCRFYHKCLFYKIEVNDLFSMRLSRFIEKVKFSDCTFNRYCDFERVEFAKRPEFERVKFYDTLSFHGTQFKDGVDFRRTNLDSIKCLILENTSYPIGEFFIDWDQIEYDDHPIISISADSTGKIDEYKRLENIYLNLRDNYIAQGNKESADDVKYELELRKDLMFSDFWHSVYGIFMGYGYKPLKYFFYLVLPIVIIFSFMYYIFSYKTVYQILTNIKEIDTKGLFEDVEIIRQRRKFWLPTYKASSNTLESEIPFLTRFWHSTHISSSLLFGLRFKKEWIRKWDKKFLVIATAEWLVGIFLYVGFALLIKSFRFDFIKGIFGL